MAESQWWEQMWCFQGGARRVSGVMERGGEWLKR